MAQNEQAVPQEDELLANAIPISEIEEEAEGAAPPAAAAGTAATLLPPVSIDLAETDQQAPKAAIRTFNTRVRQEEHWHRKPNTTGQGAVHLKTFVCKLRQDAVDNLDVQVNEWLEAHPEFEVKFVTATTGNLTGKLTEPALFLNIWV